MSKYIKISQQPPSPTVTEFSRQQMSEQSQQTAYNTVMSKNDPYMGVYSRLQEIARQYGKNWEELKQELQERSNLIRLMLVHMDEDSVARYFEEFLFKKNFSWADTSTLWFEAIRGATLPFIDLTEALDFALNHYYERQILPTTLYIMEKVRELQPAMPEVSLYAILNDATKNKSVSLSIFQLSEKNEEKTKLILGLLGLVYAKTEEDLDRMRIEFAQTQNEAEKALEIDRRYKAIYDALFQDEFFRQQARVTQLLTRSFIAYSSDKNLQMIMRIMIGLKLGESVRKVFFSPVIQTNTSNFPSPEKSPGSKQILNENENKFIKLSQKNPAQKYNLSDITISDDKKNELQSLVKEYYDFVIRLKKLYTQISKDPRINPDPVNDARINPISINDTINDCQKIIDNLKKLDAILKQSSPSAKDFISIFIECNDKLRQLSERKNFSR